jgi:RNA polymerase sigma factor (TIGR02999 family)
MPDPSRDVTQLLAKVREGDQSALDALLPLLYDELRRIAVRHLKRERRGHTLQPTALVHEAYLRLVQQREPAWQSRAHFLNAAAQVMRRILVDYARARQTDKRAGVQAQVALEDALMTPDRRDLDLVALDDALLALAARDPRQSRIVELRYFGGLTTEEIAEVLGVSVATVAREWAVARLWLCREIQRGEPS